MGGRSLAFYHNDSVDLYESNTQRPSDLGIEGHDKDLFDRFGFFLKLLKSGKRPFGHPFIGTSVPLAAAETIFRFALGKPPGTELEDIFADRAIKLRWHTLGLGTVLHQCRYFDVGPDGKVFNTLKEPQPAPAFT